MDQWTIRSTGVNSLSHLGLAFRLDECLSKFTKKRDERAHETHDKGGCTLLMPANSHAHDPWTTLATILLFLICFNLVLAITTVAASLLFGTKVNPIDRVFEYREIHFRSIPGFNTFFMYILTAIFSVPLEVFIVKRAKLVLDFAMTIMGFHLLFTTLYSGCVPRSGAWWITWFLNCIIMVFGGEYACMRQELKPILFSTKYTAIPSTIGQGDSTTVEHHQTAGSKSGIPRLPGSARASIHEPRRSTGGDSFDVDDIELEERSRLMEEGKA